MKRKNSFLIFNILCVLLTFKLGVWQVQRYHYKNSLNDALRFTKENPEKYTGQDLEQFKMYELNGILNQDNILTLVERPFAGKQVNFIYSYFSTNSGKNFVIELGFVAKGQKINFQTLLSDLAKQELAIKILARASGKSNSFIPDNNPQKNQWYYVEPRQFSEVFSVPLEMDFYLQFARADLLESFEFLKQRELSEINNPHLKYVIFWFTICVILVFLGQNFYRKNFASATKNSPK